MSIKEYPFLPVYSSKGEEIARIRVKFETNKGIVIWSITQLEGLVLAKWLPLIRYDFAPQEKPAVHIHKEYMSITHKEKFDCHPQRLVKVALNKLKLLSENQILDFTEKRKQVFLRERK